MKSAATLLSIAVTCTPALATKPCDELKSEIAAKLDAAGVKNYILEVVETAKVGDAKIVGSCDGGTKKITYSKN